MGDDRSGKVRLSLWLTATVGTAQTEDESKLLKFVFPGAQHAVDLWRRLISSSGRGATLLHSNKICAAAWQNEKWLKCVHRLRGASLYRLFFHITAVTNLILSLSVCGLLCFIHHSSLSHRQNERPEPFKAAPWRRLQQSLQVADQTASVWLSLARLLAGCSSWDEIIQPINDVKMCFNIMNYNLI